MLFRVITAILLPLVVNAQTVHQFTVQLDGTKEVPVNATQATGFGLLSLYGNTLYFNLGVEHFYEWSANIHGPGLAGSNAPPLFELSPRACFPPRAPSVGGCAWLGPVTLTDKDIANLSNGLLYVRVQEPYGSAVRGQIVPDQDWDFVTDAQDRCPNTPVCDPWDRPTPNCPSWFTPNVDSRGCLLDQLPSMCPCENSKNHGQYVRCVNEAVGGFVREGFLTGAQGEELQKAAAHSDCAKKR